MRFRLKHDVLAALISESRESQNRWAQRIGVSRGYLSLLVNGKRRYPPERTRRKLLRATGLSFDELFAAVAANPWRAPAPQPSEGLPAAVGPNPWIPPMASLLQGLRLSFTSLLRSPTFAIVTVLTLGLAIGVNTAIFSLVRLFIFDPFPIREPETLGFVRAIDTRRGIDDQWIAEGDFLDYRREVTAFEKLAAMDQDVGYILTGGGEPTRLQGSEITANLLTVWGMRPWLGRDFRPEDDRPGAPPVVMLAHGSWQQRFGGDPGIIGTTLELNGRPATVIGVMDPEIEIGSFALIDLWAPLRLEHSSASRSERRLWVIGKLAPDSSLEQAAEQLNAVNADLARRFPDSHEGWVVDVEDWEETIANRDTWTVLLLLAITVGCVMLIACSNVATLMLVRASQKARETVVRLALGAGRARIVAQFLTEGALLALAGGALGLLLAGVIQRFLVWMVSEDSGAGLVFRLLEIDSGVLAFTVAVSVAAPLLFGLFPATHVLRLDLQRTLQESGRSSGNRRGFRTRRMLVAGQVSVALALIVLAGALIHTALERRGLDVGIRTAGVVTMRIDLPENRYGQPGEQQRFFTAAHESVARLPEVAASGWISNRPIGSAGPTRSFSIPGRDHGPDTRPWTQVLISGRGYHQTLEFPLLRGRLFDESDSEASAPVTVVNQRLAEVHWPDEDPVGKEILLDTGAGQSRLRIVGVVGNVHTGSVSRPAEPALYLPLSQHPRPGMALVVRTRSGDPLEATSRIREAIYAIDPAQPIDDVKTLDQLKSDALSALESVTTLFGAFALFALILAATGIYGVTAFSVAQRRREIGIRMALGAMAGDVRRMVARQAVVIILAGIGVGSIGAVALTSVLGSAISGVSTVGPGSHAVVAGTFLVIVLVAAWLPACAATRVDPVKALRLD